MLGHVKEVKKKGKKIDESSFQIVAINQTLPQPLDQLEAFWIGQYHALKSGNKKNEQIYAPFLTKLMEEKTGIKIIDASNWSGPVHISDPQMKGFHFCNLTCRCSNHKGKDCFEYCLECEKAHHKSSKCEELCPKCPERDIKVRECLTHTCPSCPEKNHKITSCPEKECRNPDCTIEKDHSPRICSSVCKKCVPRRPQVRECSEKHCLCGKHMTMSKNCKEKCVCSKNHQNKNCDKPCDCPHVIEHPHLKKDCPGQCQKCKNNEHNIQECPIPCACPPNQVEEGICMNRNIINNECQNKIDCYCHQIKLNARKFKHEIKDEIEVITHHINWKRYQVPSKPRILTMSSTKCVYKLFCTDCDFVKIDQENKRKLETVFNAMKKDKKDKCPNCKEKPFKIIPIDYYDKDGKNLKFWQSIYGQEEEICYDLIEKKILRWDYEKIIRNPKGQTNIRIPNKFSYKIEEL